MCGVAGIYAYHSDAPAVERSELVAIRDRMAARGPDGKGEWYSGDGRVGLGHRRLSIIDLSDRASQPMASPGGELVITFNGEIYNYRELRQELEARGCVFRTESDTEVLLQLYSLKGEAALLELRGMFAFAIWDARKRAVLLARDPYGIKPLYYADDGKTFRFASQVKALLAGGRINTAPEPAGHVGFFLWGSVPSPWTLYRGIRNLPGGHYVWVGGHGTSECVPYCSISGLLAKAAAEPAAGNAKEALDVIGESCRDSVRAHLVSDVPIAMFLSAGLDSAMITEMATKYLRNTSGDRPHTMTLAFAEFAGTEMDEAPLAERLAAVLGTRHATIMVRRDDFEEERESLLAAMDQPTIDGVNTWFVSRAAASQGIKVALSGLGGDELFASYPSFAELPRITSLASPFSRVPQFGRLLRQTSEPLLSRFTSPKFAGLMEYGASLGGAYLLRRAVFMPWELTRVMDEDMARQGWRDLQALDRLNDSILGMPRKSGSRLSISALEMAWYMSNQLLRDTDWASMAHSLEVRVPFLDIPLLKSVAPWLAVHQGLSKRKVAQVIASHMPDSLLSRSKTGFVVPVREWLLADQPLQKGRGLRAWSRYIHKRFSE